MKSGDIVLVRYPFTDFSDEKLRPALVLLPEDEEGDYLLAFITSIPLQRSNFDYPILAEKETGLKVANLINRGVLEFVAPEKPEIQSRRHIFITKDYEGNIIETEECYSKWHKLDKLPLNEMWDDDVIWLEKLLVEEKEVRYRFFLNQDEKLEKHEEI